MKKPTKKVLKQGKKKTFKLDKRSSSSGDSKKMRVAVGAVGVGAALLGLAYIQTISPMLRKKKIEAEEAKLQSQINETVRGRIAEKAESVKARALNLADIKVLAESYSTGTSRSTTPKTSPTTNVPVVLPKTPVRIFKSPTEPTNVGIFTREQREAIYNMVITDKDPKNYIENITKQIYIPSSIRLGDKPTIDERIHVIQGAALGYRDSDILKGLEQIRKHLKTAKFSKEQDKLSEDISEKLLEAIEYEYSSSINSTPRTSGSGRSRTSAASLKNT